MGKKSTRLVLTGLVAMFALLNGGLRGGVFLAYVVRPVLWAFMAFAVFRLLPKQNPIVGLSKRSLVLQIALLAGVMQISFSIMFGLLEGFGRSPYSSTLRGMAINVWVLATEILGVEASRAWLISAVSKRRKPNRVVLVALLYFFVTTSLRSGLGLTDKLAIVQWLGGRVLPALALNLACTHLAFVGGVWGPVLYRGLVLGFLWFSPILPDLSWGASALVETAIPIVLVFMAQAEFGRALGRKTGQKSDGRETGKTILTALFAMLVIWFAVGLFPIYPRVIVTGSMIPAVQIGDMVLIRKTADIEVGDIMEYQTENAFVLHRVIAIVGEGNSRRFVTKGDANSHEDSEPVSVPSVRGRMIGLVPKIGLLSIFMRGAVAR